MRVLGMLFVVLASIALSHKALAEGPPVATVSGATINSSIVKFVPASEVQNNDDIDPNGNCLVELKRHCNGTSVGEGRLADCLSDLIAESELAQGDDGETPTVSDACIEDVYQYKISRNSNINKNIPLAKACKVDADKFCNVTWFFGYKKGQVIACLRDVRDKLAPACKKLIYKTQQDAAMDFRADAQLYEACKADATSVCKDVKNGGGRVQACLRDNRMKLSWGCEEQLFRQEMENSDDIRLSVRLFVKCLKEKQTFCADIAPGAARVKDCLEEHRTEPAFGTECKEEVDGMIERRMQDFRLDSRLRRSCERDINSLCAFFGDMEAMEGDDTSVVRCLQDYMAEIQDATCKAQVTKYQQLAAENIRFDVPLAEACFEDRQRICADVPPGSARVIRCLMGGRDRLTATCRAVLFDEEVRFSENIDFQYPMKEACKKELELFCRSVPHGQARAIRCLQEHSDAKDFGRECREQVRAYEQEASSDYRFNFRLSTACKADIGALCTGVCEAEEGQICGGTVLRCLTDQADAIKAEACKKEVFYYTKMEVTDFRNDVILATACRQDVEEFCHLIRPGEGRVHECLRQNRKKLSEQCRQEELRLEETEAENVELRPGLMRTCRDERSSFCSNVQPGQARVFRCLAEKMNDADFGEKCRNEIISKLQRRQANWKLDPPLRKACKAAVNQLCMDEDHAMSETGAVYKCLLKHTDDVDVACQRELGRALHMALYVWQPDAILTATCDEDVRTLCLENRPNMARSPGAVAACLARVAEQLTDPKVKRDPSAPTLSDACRTIVEAAEPPNMKKAFDASLAVVLLQSQLTALESGTGLSMVRRDAQGNAQGISLTGWSALLGIMSMLLLALYGITYTVKRYRGVHEAQGYTLVVKGKGR